MAIVSSYRIGRIVNENNGFVLLTLETGNFPTCWLYKVLKVPG
jgi:hypothetical protein